MSTQKLVYECLQHNDAQSNIQKVETIQMSIN